MMMWHGFVIVFPCAESAVCAIADLTFGIVAACPLFATLIFLFVSLSFTIV